MRYTVKHADPTAVEADLVRLWGENLTIPGGPRRKFQWTYREPPVRPETVFLLQADDLASVGTAGVGVRTFQVGDEQRRAALLGDFAVDKAHRTLMPALTLMKEVRRTVVASSDFAYGFPNKLAEGVMKRVGYTPLGVMTRYARVLRHARYVRRVVDVPIGTDVVAEVGGRVLDAAFLARGLPAAIRAARTHRLEWTLDVDERFDRLWADARGDWSIAAVRSAEFLCWRFLRHPVDRFGVATLVARDSRRIDAYAVVQRDGDVAHLRDLFGHRDDVGTLLDLLIPTLYREGSASVSFRFLGPTWVSDLIESRRFAQRDAERTVIYDAADRTPFADASRWYLTDGDEDT